MFAFGLASLHVLAGAATADGELVLEQLVQDEIPEHNSGTTASFIDVLQRTSTPQKKSVEDNPSERTHEDL
eukprot:280572-Amphidinium_carterae.1